MPSLSASVDKPICVPSEIPTDWVWQELVKCCRPRQWPTISKEQLIDEGFPVYGANGLIGYYSEYNHEKPTIAVTCRGATCGTLNYVPAQSYITGNAMCLDELDLEKVSESYLYYALFHRGLFDVITGSAQPQITAQSLKKVTFPCPPLSEQKKIAEILESVDDAIAKTESVIAQTQRVKQGLLQQLLTRGIGHTKFKQTPLGEIPENWEISTLASLADLKGGFAFNSGDFIDNGVQVIRMGNLYQSKLQLDRNPVYVPNHFLEEHKTFRIYPNDILMSMTGTVGKQDYGYAVIVPHAAPDLLLNQRVCKLIPKKETDYNYLLQLLWSRLFLEQLYSLPGGTKQANLSGKQILSVEIPLPPYREQKIIGNILSSVDALLKTEKESMDKQIILKAGLMSDLLTGLVRVNVDAKTLDKIEEAA